MIEIMLFWNIRSLRTLKAFDRPMDMHRRQHYSFIALMESFQEPAQIEVYKRKLGFRNTAVNTSGKIWYFWKDDWEAEVLLDSIQQVTVKYSVNNKLFIISAVYARCNINDRLEL